MWGTIPYQRRVSSLSWGALAGWSGSGTASHGTDVGSQSVESVLYWLVILDRGSKRKRFYLMFQKSAILCNWA